ncbi:hypothetical protein MFORT_11021 [Mycolicibacterium fortuitum subsp. fortuitum DSM 46621 = ATCC 6841 = JCM 6387]|uniref:Uncharacterized protein n=1 Tax=Mycolicibacterium fortuitum subsp. fortuitum DSM 46621 = ATCC 6841 = JCM 6387 TaxID=1214102 RepID=K0V965_MYCFO|nr:hypothetical protein MFORT_11021 [Mycolicibacterium fortuitum subsp. fortuitum DSM 46621 = ATCC 6841 = JCM 6387]
MAETRISDESIWRYGHFDFAARIREHVLTRGQRRVAKPSGALLVGCRLNRVAPISVTRRVTVDGELQGAQGAGLGAQPITHSRVGLDQTLTMPLDILSVLFGGPETIGHGGNVDLAAVSDVQPFVDTKSVSLGGGDRVGNVAFGGGDRFVTVVGGDGHLLDHIALMSNQVEVAVCRIYGSVFGIPGPVGVGDASLILLKFL